MHKKYSKDDFAAVSVSLDDPNEKGVQDKIRKWLTDKGATFTNLILDEKPETWQDKLQIEGPPVVIVYGRDGKVAKKFDPGFEYSDVEKVVKELMEKK